MLVPYQIDQGIFERGDPLYFNSAAEFLPILEGSPEVWCGDYMPYFIGISPRKPAKPQGKIVPFPGVTPPEITVSPIPANKKQEREQKEKAAPPPRIITARPGEPVPPGIPDFRKALQRDGLILVSYSRLFYPQYRYAESRKKIWAAYWVCSLGRAFFYCGTFKTEKEAAFVMPDEVDGDNYRDSRQDIKRGQWRVPYMVHVAPDLFGINLSSLPRGRPEHIAKLRGLGYTTNFEAAFSLSELKNRERKEKIERAKCRLLWEARNQKNRIAKNG
jgi:hypothetical protein